MLEESGIQDKENGEDDEYMEIDYGVVMPQSDDSASVPSASVSDREDSVNNFNVHINLSSLSELPRLHYSLAITIDRSILDHSLSSNISNSCISSLSVPGISSCCSISISNSIAYMLSPTIVNISATTTVVTTAVATTAATAAAATTAAAFAAATTVATSTATAAAAAFTTAATIDTTTTTISSMSTTTVATATNNSGNEITARPVYPKFGLFQFNNCMHCASLVHI